MKLLSMGFIVADARQSCAGGLRAGLPVWSWGDRVNLGDRTCKLGNNGIPQTKHVSNRRHYNMKSDKNPSLREKIWLQHGISLSV